MADAVEVEIAHLGAQGDGVVGDGVVADGVAGSGAAARFVPFALPGERWRVDGAEAARLTASPERIEPICRHFGRCGGCVAQHMSGRLYADWKRDIVVEAFRHRGVEADVLALHPVKRDSRRRAFLGVERHGANVTIGFREAGAHTLVDLGECPVLDPAIVGALGRLREMARLVMPEAEGGRLLVTRLDHGLDVSFDNGAKGLAPEVRETLAGLAAAAGLVRLTVGGELIVVRGPPTMTLGGVAVEASSAVFLQAVPEAEAALIELVVAALPKRVRRIADLFCGLGTFTFALARRAPVAAYDGDKRAIGALVAAARGAQGLKPIEAKVRDLFREPLSARELDGFDAVVLDPPRAGAQAQVERIGKSKVPLVVYVSCNAATLARDAKALIDAGLGMGPVAPVDQFLFSPHVESVTVFRR